MGRPARAADLQVKQEIAIPARTGVGFRVEAGQFIQVLDVSGSQCADFFAFHADDPREYLSAAHTRVAVERLFPQVNQSFFSSLRRPLLQFEEDRSPGIHDMLFAACDGARYAQYGVPGHGSCADNLRAAAEKLGIELCHVPQPVNFFMNVAVRLDGRCEFASPQTNPGDHVLLKAFQPCLVIVSACPQEWNPAANFHPSDLLARVLVAA
jgi:uncharacterized protein YcgI (DUF1989 family)